MGVIQGYSKGYKPIAKVMAFVDGGYLRKQCKTMFDEDINFSKLKERIMGYFNANCNGKYDGDIVRIYYYDAIVYMDHPKHGEQKSYFDKIHANNAYEVHLGHLVNSGKKGVDTMKQKGVDVLLAVDMITKAYTDQFDFAVLIAGDADFVEVVDAVKDTGKRVFGMYFRKHIADDLYDVFDARIEIDNFVNDLKIATV